MATIHATRPSPLSPGADHDLRTTEPRGAACLNCGATLSGAFCAGCGQRDVPAYPSVRELARDAFEELSGWDGRFASTLRALFLQPGRLTREFLEGRRARYISPVRLYLTASVIYFVLAAAAPTVRTSDGKAVSVGIRIGSTAGKNGTVSRPERVAAAADRALESREALTDQERAAALQDIARAPALFQPFLRRAVADPAGFRRGLLEAMPRLLFALLPVLAGIIGLFYRGRKYPEHLYFAIHLNAFLFLALGLAELVKFTRSAPVLIASALLVVASIPVYATLAFRRVYGGSVAGTLAKEAAICVMYGAVSFAAFVVVVYLVAVAG